MYPSMVARAEPTVRRCRPGDVALLAELSRRTFTEAYADKTRSDEMSRHLAEAFDSGQVREELSNPESSFYVAAPTTTC